jgi:hypothetical protein
VQPETADGSIFITTEKGGLARAKDVGYEEKEGRSP